jgi:hypothetical protein
MLRVEMLQEHEGQAGVLGQAPQEAREGRQAAGGRADTDDDGAF